jgi:uracil-DNA glycosylase
MTPEEKLKELTSLYKECHSCKLCSLHRNLVPLPNWTKGPYVFGAGKIGTKMVLVGQNPGRNEVIQQRPFVGAAGEKLNAALEEAGFNRKDLYVTNSVLCYTIGNQMPELESVEACSYFLSKQIAIINPDIVVVMGASGFRSFRTFDNERYSVAFCREKRIIKTDLHDNVLVTIHPAHIIYKPQDRNVLVDSFIAAKNFIDNLNTKEFKEV